MLYNNFINQAKQMQAVRQLYEVKIRFIAFKMTNNTLIFLDKCINVYYICE
jgi:hypothetical protein